MEQSYPRVAVLGAGAMGGALTTGLLRSGWPADHMILCARRESRAAETQQALGCRCVLTPSEAIEGAGVLIVSVKPKDVPALLMQLVGRLEKDQTLVSFAAGVPIQTFEKALGEVAVLRAMPNIPASVGEGITPWAKGKHVHPSHEAAALRVLGSVGGVFPLEEQLLDAVTAVSGTGPAYAFLLAEALIESAVREGLPRDVSERLVHHTLKGAGTLLVETDAGPTELRARVTSPGGTTAAAVHVLEERGFRALVEDAVRAAALRSQELGKKAPSKN